MTIADIKAGGWAAGERLLSSQMNTARTEMLKCVDGDGGGTYTPSATISIDDLTVGGGNALKYDSRGVAATIPMIPIDIGADWAWNNTAALWYTTAAGTSSMWFGAKLPNPCTLTDAVAWVKGSGHGALPAVMPRLEVWVRALNTDSSSASFSADDSSATFGAFDTIHFIQATGSVAITTQNVFVRVINESGANSQNTFKLLGVQLSVTMTEQHEWPG